MKKIYIIFKNKKIISFIFLINIPLCLLVIYTVNILLIDFNFFLSYFDAFSFYTSSILISAISMLNYIGAFEIALSISGSYYQLLPATAIIFGITLRFLNFLSLVFIYLFLLLLRLFFYKSVNID